MTYKMISFYQQYKWAQQFTALCYFCFFELLDYTDKMFIQVTQLYKKQK